MKCCSDYRFGVWKFHEKVTCYYDKNNMIGNIIMVACMITFSCDNSIFIKVSRKHNDAVKNRSF
jgi:hypothetical protein